MAEPHVDFHPTVEETAERIAAMDVRGAAAIADEAALALRKQAEASDATDPGTFRAELRGAARRLRDTRPTAVSLPNALRYVFRGMGGETVEQLRESAIASVEEFRAELDQAQAKLGRIGANRLRDGDTVMFHCHSTDALSCVDAALDQGKEIEAIVKETRPRKQGHITARQLREWGVPVTLIVDSGARRYLDDADHVLVGADSIAADGSVINKVGTSGLAVNARERGVPIMVAAQTIKLHPDTMTGHTVEIEMRDRREVLPDDEREEISALDDDGLTVENPAFDVTPPRYIDAIVTERGQYPPESVVVLIRELFGEHTGTEPWEEA
ncbi:ribose 1,5-bisphosphate isomerase [Halobacteriales archaeon QS_1_68_20]|nr:MAG: ribose 1,5-bisphosphate isomerase [Halobacteriales archaeon QS_1_68_20]